MRQRIVLSILLIISLFMIIQTIRFNSVQNKLNKIKFTNLCKNEVTLDQIFDDKKYKLLIYILPDCEFCIEKIDAILKLNNQSNTQLIIVSVGINNFDYEKYYNQNFKLRELQFYIDQNNTFYRDFGLGFTEDFPTVIKYNTESNEVIRLK
jgi:hypothetical protein